MKPIFTIALFIQISQQGIWLVCTSSDIHLEDCLFESASLFPTIKLQS